MEWGCKVKPTRDGFVAYLQGELDHHMARELCQALDKLLYRYPVKEVVFDLSALAFMDSAGIGLILGRYSKIEALGGRLILQNPSTSMEKILRLSGISARVEIRKTQSAQKKTEKKGTIPV